MTKSKSPPLPTEHEEQSALFEWARWMEKRYPELKLLHAIPNGGHRTPRTAAMLQREGVKAGVPDICLPVPNGECKGLYIELKRRKRWKVSPEQLWWMESLTRQGYMAALCFGWDMARETICKYLGIEEDGV